MAICVIAGSRVLASADDTVPVYVAASDIAAGTALGDVDLVVRQVRFADDEQRAAYLAPASTAADLSFVRVVKAGELIPAAALDRPEAAGRVQVPLSVDPDQVPPAVRAGSVVDVYLLGPGSGSGAQAEPALASAGVVAAPDPADAFVATGRRQLVVSVPEAQARAFLARLGAAERPTVTVVRRR